ncbi:MAG: DeoR/GlpR transcriptional regulator [Oscillospiraceae bacterium]|nr:DeoR/GlpR transcriptional regulator [Oscillospiraceae bacterium]MBQ8731687.1 DeoR/GlpR transcriptional regulator [Oscillospiraceae bacterium]
MDISPEQSVDQRRQAILDLLDKRGKVRVTDLSRMFELSEVTIRNDLSELEATGRLERVHGGAVSTNKSYFNMSFHERITRYETEKQNIAKAAAAMINPNDTLMINSGTTTFFIAQELKTLKSLTVVTNSVVIAHELTPIPGFNVILLGGNFNPQYQFTYGEDALSQLRRYKTDKLILSADGVDSQLGLTTHHYQEADVSRAMLDRVNQSIVVADFTKIGRENFAHIAGIDRVDRLITNTSADPEELERIADHGVEISVV